MNASIQILRDVPIDVFGEGVSIDTWRREGAATLDDKALIALCAQTIEMPKRARGGSSFVLHAPLELLARAALLQHVAPDVRDFARRRIAEIGVRYANAGDEMQFDEIHFSNESTARTALLRAVSEGDQSIAHNAMRFFIDRKHPDELRALLIDSIAPLLGAAGHCPILLSEWRRGETYSQAAGRLILAPLHYLLATPQARLRWIDTVSWQDCTPARESTEALTQALSRALKKPHAIKVESNSIAPQLTAADTSPHIASALREPLLHLPLPIIEKTLLRTAAQSMLQDDPAHAAYGWTHCLTLPLALIANADASENPRKLYAIAATYVYAFRAAAAHATVDVDCEPVGNDSRLPQQAAATAFRATEDQRHALRTRLASAAAAHRDAHLVKYTLACFDAAERDPEFERIYLATAAYLNAWWHEHDRLRAGATV
jgi:hypothetical protein